MGEFYESPRDRKNEQEIAKELAGKYHCKYFKLPVAYHADFAFLREEKVVGLVEARRRFNDFATYPTIIVAVQKRLGCLELSRALKVPCIFAVKYNDGLYTIDLEQEPDDVTVGGRNEIRDSRDVEIVYHYNTNRLKQIK